ncbi:MAG: hypothetical protein ACRDN6_08180 [Gaiellaceae bacterium]
MTTPAPTKVALAATVAVTAAGLVAFTALAGAIDVDPRLAGWFLLLFAVLFLVRVAAQIVVALRGPPWLPPMHDWHLMPYRLLLPIQVVFLAVMAWLVRDFLAGSGRLTEPSPDVGLVVVGLSALYAGAMVVRYVVRMRRRPDQRWFGGAIPIVFHWVLASFLFVLGFYHGSYDSF